jgi:hypothetical protein
MYLHNSSRVMTDCASYYGHVVRNAWMNEKVTSYLIGGIRQSQVFLLWTIEGVPDCWHFSRHQPMAFTGC